MYSLILILTIVINTTNQNKGRKLIFHTYTYIEYILIHIQDYTEEDLDRIYQEWEQNEEKEEVPVR